MIQLSERYSEITSFFRDKFSNYKVDSAIILGSGLGDMLNESDILHEIDTSEIPDYPTSTVSGHKGKIQIVRLSEKLILSFSGRIHFYEGYQLSQCLLPVHLAHIAGVRNIVITNAAGGANPEFHSGDLMLMTGINAAALKPKLSEFFGTPLHVITSQLRSFPEKELYARLIDLALDEHIYLQKGVYWYMSGPNYETPAEIRMIQKCGGDAVGMSSVHEIIYAQALGMNTIGISCITNMAAGLSKVKLNHAEVKDTAERVKDTLSRYLRKVLTTL